VEVALREKGRSLSKIIRSITHVLIPTYRGAGQPVVVQQMRISGRKQFWANNRPEPLSAGNMKVYGNLDTLAVYAFL
jgi:hypothetical protein